MRDSKEKYRNTLESRVAITDTQNQNIIQPCLDPHPSASKKDAILTRVINSVTHNRVGFATAAKNFLLSSCRAGARLFDAPI